MSINNKIREARKKKGLTQSGLAKLIGKSLRMIQKYESDETSPTNVIPSIDVLHKIAHVLNVSVDDLIEDENPIRRTTKEINKIRLYIYDLNSELEKSYESYRQKLEKFKLDESKKEIKTELDKLENECNKIEDFKADAERKLDSLYDKLSDLMKKADTFEEFGDMYLDEREKEEGKRLLEEKTSINKDKKRNELLITYEKLNETGKEEAIKRVGELTQIKKYRIEDNFSFTVNYDEAD